MHNARLSSELPAVASKQVQISDICTVSEGKSDFAKQKP